MPRRGRAATGRPRAGSRLLPPSQLDPGRGAHKLLPRPATQVTTNQPVSERLTAPLRELLLAQN